MNTLKSIVAGSRGITDFSVVSGAIEKSPFKGRIAEVVSGGARGVDQLGEEYARLGGIKVVRFPAEWGKYGRAAGPIRNQQMALYADVLVAVWDGQSRGTRSMIDKMEALGKPVFAYLVGHKNKEK